MYLCPTTPVLMAGHTGVPFMCLYVWVQYIGSGFSSFSSSATNLAKFDVLCTCTCSFMYLNVHATELLCETWILYMYMHVNTMVLAQSYAQWHWTNITTYSALCSCEACVGWLAWWDGQLDMCSWSQGYMGYKCCVHENSCIATCTSLTYT
jgi:hypothetical protein